MVCLRSYRKSLRFIDDNFAIFAVFFNVNKSRNIANIQQYTILFKMNYSK